MSDDPPLSGDVLVFRTPVGKPVAVPREVAEAAERPLRAYSLRVMGYSWDRIAAMEGYPTPAAASRDVSIYINEGRALVSDFSRQQLVEIELSRLDAMQSGLWEDACKGNAGSVGMVLRIMDTRIRLLSLEPVQRVAEVAGTRHVTIVVPPDQDGYKAALTRMAGETA